MGASSSKSAEGRHFFSITQPSRKRRNSLGSDDDVEKLASNTVIITSRARILKYVSYELLWSNFLSGPANSFALTVAEASLLLTDSIKDPEKGDSSDDKRPLDSEIQADVNSYMELLKELNGKSVAFIDFMTLCSSVMFLSQDPIEVKIDKLFEWITMGIEEFFQFDELLIAVNSFEKGLSSAMGKPGCSEDFSRAIAIEYMTLADPSYTVTNKDTKITQKQFFEVCTSRQEYVRRLVTSST
jgi:hypothetical protein